MHISVEGLDGVGKTTVCSLLSKEIDFEYVEKPLRYLFDNKNGKNYDTITKMINENPNRNISAWFYCFGSLYLYDLFKTKNIITDRHLCINYAYGGNDNTKVIYDSLLSLIGPPTLTVILYANQNILKERIKKRCETDTDLLKHEDVEFMYKKMIMFCKMNKFEYIVINTENHLPEEIVDMIKSKLNFRLEEK